MDSQARAKEKRTVSVAMRPTHRYRVGQATTDYGALFVAKSTVKQEVLVQLEDKLPLQNAGFINTKY